jgi:hypothetical protein
LDGEFHWWFGFNMKMGMSNEEMRQFLIKFVNDDFGLKSNPKPYNPSTVLRTWHKVSFLTFTALLIGGIDYFLHQSMEIKRHQAKIETNYERFFVHFTDKEFEQYHEMSTNMFSGNKKVMNASKSALWSSHYSRIQERSKILDLIEEKIDELNKKL